jgi:glycosyltransferase involved in cell wall biosynthesis
MARDIQPFLRSAHLFAYCSQLDSCPLSVIEAQAYGLPIFIGRHSAATDFLIRMIQKQRQTLSSNCSLRLRG